jgi:hypothetical protein
MKTERWVKILMAVLAVGLLASAIAVLAQQGGVAVPVDEVSSSINAMVVIGKSGTSQIIAAGTNDGIRVFEVARVGNQYEVRDVTRYTTSEGAPVIRSSGTTAPEPTGGEAAPRLPRTMDRGFTVPPPERRDPARLPRGIDRDG